MFAVQENQYIYLFVLICHQWVCGVVADIYNGEYETVYPGLNCTFEEGICSWRHSSLWNELKWTITRNDFDHTTGDGYYLRLSNDQRATALRARLQSPPVVTQKETCLSFWYYMKSNHVGELSVYRIGSSLNEKHQLFRIFGAQGSRWYRALVPTGTGTYQLEITGTVNSESSYLGIRLDDISLSYEKCPQNDEEILKNQPHIACDFEESLCSWYSYTLPNSISWVTTSMETETRDRNPLPPGNTGHRVAMLLRKKSSYNVEGQLKGPTISVDERKACFSFWYKLKEDMVRWLEVRLLDHWTSLPHNPLTVYSSEKLSRGTWIQANVTLPKRNNFYITIAAMTRKRVHGLLLVDDINISYGGPCPKANQEALINCNFDKDMCRWYMTTNQNESDWARLKGPTPTNFTGPSRDHTTGDGYYLFFDASTVESAFLYSQDIYVDSTEACFSFWYYMHGKDVYRLDLSVAEEPQMRRHLWTLEGEQEDKWILQNVSLPSFKNKPVRLIFNADSLYFPRGDIAIDDISITFGAPCEIDIPEPSEPDYFEETTLTTDVTATSDDIIPISTTPEIIYLPNPHLIVKDGPLTLTVYEHSRVELDCQFSTHLSVTTVWIKGDVPSIHHADKIREHASNILVYEEIRLNDGGHYACAIADRSRAVSEPSNFVKIDVVSDPRRKPHLYADVYSDDNNPLKVEQTARLMCGFLDLEGVQYHWKTNSTAFTNTPLPNSRVLTLNDTQPEHSGVYSCRITKDQFMTAKSRELKIVVQPGKPCDYDWNCKGNEYKSHCFRGRCKCHRDALPIGPRCLFKPEKPKIVTFPRFLEYGIGESFYIICRTKTPAPPTLKFTFITPRGEIESHNVLKIQNATDRENGDYSCFVTHRQVASRSSNAITIQIKEFADLKCNFRKDVCKWSHVNLSGFTKFERIDSPVQPASKNPRAFIRVPESHSDTPYKAMLISPTVDRTTLNSCLTFQYRMLGSDVRGLSVLSYTFSQRLQEDGGTRLWTVIGEKGRKWSYKNITIPPANDFYIAFEAIGSVAIADVKFVYRGGC